MQLDYKLALSPQVWKNLVFFCPTTYLQKPIDLDDLVSKIWNLVVRSKITHPYSIQEWIKKQNLGKKSYADALLIQDWLPFVI